VKINNSINNQSQSRPAFGMKFSERTYKLAETAGEETLKIFKRLAEDTKTHDLFVDIEPPKTTSKWKLFWAKLSVQGSMKRHRATLHVGYETTPKNVMPANSTLMYGMPMGSTFDSVVANHLDNPKTANRVRTSMFELLRKYPEYRLSEDQLEFVEKMHLQELSRP